MSVIVLGTQVNSPIGLALRKFIVEDQWVLSYS